MGFIVTRGKGLKANAAIGTNLRVKELSTGKFDVAGLAERGIGILEEASFAAGDSRNITLWSAQGTVPCVANGAIALGAPVYAAAAGKGTATVGVLIGYVLGTVAPAADGDYFEMLPASGDGVSVNGLKMVAGEVTLDGSNPTPILTGLTAVLGCQVTRKSAVAPGLDPLLFSVDYGGGVAAGTVNVYGWKATAANDATEIASTNATCVLSYLAFGTP